MKGMRTALGISLGAGIGMVIGLVFADQAWIWWLIVGAAVGLIIGAFMDSQSPDDPSTDEDPGQTGDGG